MPVEIIGEFGPLKAAREWNSDHATLAIWQITKSLGNRQQCIQSRISLGRSSKPIAVRCNPHRSAHSPATGALATFAFNRFALEAYFSWRVAR